MAIRELFCGGQLQGFGGAGVLELVEDDEDGTYRAVCTVRFAQAVFVLHCFQEKSKRGIATPKENIDSVVSGLIDAIKSQSQC